mmetsp:Transcript_15654/g.30909  ORF Transcript_15654/g.30909 Transcript_15654/m.30909 type:complete len:239 (-) Transcript_15654:1505-2221(-)
MHQFHFCIHLDSPPQSLQCPLVLACLVQQVSHLVQRVSKLLVPERGILARENFDRVLDGLQRLCAPAPQPPQFRHVTEHPGNLHTPWADCPLEYPHRLGVHGNSLIVCVELLPPLSLQLTTLVSIDVGDCLEKLSLVRVPFWMIGTRLHKPHIQVFECHVQVPLHPETSAQAQARHGSQIEMHEIVTVSDKVENISIRFLCQGEPVQTPLQAGKFQHRLQHALRINSIAFVSVIWKHS